MLGTNYPTYFNNLSPLKVVSKVMSNIAQGTGRITYQGKTVTLELFLVLEIKNLLNSIKCYGRFCIINFFTGFY